LLYLVSGILDGDADAPIVGLRRHTTGEAPYDRAPCAQVARFLSLPENRLVLAKTRDDAAEGLRSLSTHHGDFDDDEQTLASLTAIIAG
jgi:hypothetical protein